MNARFLWRAQTGTRIERIGGKAMLRKTARNLPPPWEPAHAMKAAVLPGGQSLMTLRSARLAFTHFLKSKSRNPEKRDPGFCPD
ncbi:hypothetical protein C8N47_1046 [Mangrovibacterium marinum]|uniref:Uncharacterized protein n=1 Tax=Mangrovibacterium marinum TaxID=1639118 RepID=A0A2T5C3W0_9BACT|nr:hypothetical protein C8N47_1046 [Mangrovibacterium marinum]